MGLDTVELVMAVEEEFAIAIPNEWAATLITLGDLRDCVIRIREARGEKIDPGDFWARVKMIMWRDHRIAEKHLVPEAEIVADLGLD